MGEGQVRRPAQRTILIIEDEGSSRWALAENLRKENFDVLEAKDGEAGLALAMGRRPDLILLDLVLPKIGGMELLKTLRADDWGKNVPVIIVTGLSDPAIISEAAGLGVSDFLVKNDWTLEAIVGKVKQKVLE
ncbi:MAG: hypothetical protein A2831_00260 [Candidatus Yanofskybacteria bacterium RIFCSPHIGHO2_01_FULL_44_17]|uniref:Response regulatory domain-containing protein n=1 Tax=Candidatus Yanofskybacteria bacterium RIFCSPHIGHO2_01_FULL_44_17 TaxID=1802668 RepID=A0A1F8EYK7_9BACT|nr:MAG: hypothetical protein A2831_00260 [Candidatus Yanofskybacteria bacterium RIFCSPHIGHO2_01_FULL_44_17]